jgi:hypothetical protein
MCDPLLWTPAGYFPSAAAALTDGATTPAKTPSSEVLGQVPTGIPTAYTVFRQKSPSGGTGSSLQHFEQSVFLLAIGKMPADCLNLEMDHTGRPQLPTGTYMLTLLDPSEIPLRLFGRAAPGTSERPGECYTFPC